MIHAASPDSVSCLWLRRPSTFISCNATNLQHRNNSQPSSNQCPLKRNPGRRRSASRSRTTTRSREGRPDFARGRRESPSRITRESAGHACSYRPSPRRDNRVHAPRVRGHVCEHALGARREFRGQAGAHGAGAGRHDGEDAAGAAGDGAGDAGRDGLDGRGDAGGDGLGAGGDD